MKTVIFGYGSQGRAQALNLRDSGWQPIIYLRETSAHKAEVLKEGLELCTDPVKAAEQTELAIFLIPDSQQSDFWEKTLQPHLPSGATLCFAHGFNIHYQQLDLREDIDIILVAPSLQGDGLRKNYMVKETVPMLTAVHQDHTHRAYRLVEDLAKAIGGAKTRIIPTTFKEETETDLFAEQAVLCGGVNALVQAGFETLVSAGYSAEIAYFSCLKELRALAERLYQDGICGLRNRISETARFGDVTRGPRVINQPEMQKILEEIRNGKFTEELLADKNKGWPRLKKLLKEAEMRHIETTRKEIEE